MEWRDELDFMSLFADRLLDKNPYLSILHQSPRKWGRWVHSEILSKGILLCRTLTRHDDQQTRRQLATLHRSSGQESISRMKRRSPYPLSHSADLDPGKSVHNSLLKEYTVD